MEPGDRRGSASNVVNCRCVPIPVPIEDAVAVEGLENIGVQLAGENLTGGLTAADVASIAATIGATKPKPKPRYSGPDQGKGEPLGDYLERTEHPGYSTWQQLDKLEKEGYDVGNLEFTKDLRSELLIKFSTEPNKLIDGYILNLNKATNNKGGILTKRTIAHEAGHAIHQQYLWVQSGLDSSPIVIKEFKKLQKNLGLNSRSVQAQEKIKKYKSDLMLQGEKYYEIKAKMPELSSAEFDDLWTATADFFGAVSKNKIGYGHSMDYYKTMTKRHAEFLAHTAENFYLGNPVFKKLYPEIYADTLKLWNELLKSR